MKHSLLKKGILGFIFTLILVSAVVVPISTLQAQPEPRTYTLLEPLPCTSGQNCENNRVTEVDLLRYINIAYKIAIGLAGVLAVFMIVVGGFQYITTDAVYEKKEGKERIQRAIQGLVLTIFSYFILYIIDPRLVQIDSSTIKLESVKTTGEIFDIDNFIRGIEDGAEAESRAQEERLRINQERNRVLEEAKNTADPVKKQELELKALDLEKQSILVAADYRLSSRKARITDTISKAFLSTERGKLDRESEAELQRSMLELRYYYNEAISEMKKKDPALTARLVDERDYTISTLESEILTKQAVLYGAANKNNSTKDYAIQSRDRIAQQDAVNLKLISTPTLKEKFITESADRVQRINNALGIQ